MKTKKLFCLFMTALLSVIGTSAYAQNVVIDGLKYSLDNEKRTAELAVQNKADVVGDIVISSSVTWEGVVYTVVSTADYAFKECKQLTSIVLPNTLRRLGKSTFLNCSALTSCIIPDNTIDTIPYCALFGTALTEFHIPEGVVYLEQRSFEKMKKLERVYLPNSVQEVSPYAFHEEYPDPLKEPIYNNRLFVRMPRNYSGKYAIPSGIEVICGNAFFGCQNITSLTIPEGVKRIEQYGLCFNQGKITQIDLPASVEYIHEESILGSFIKRITVAEGNKRYKTWNNILFTINMDTTVYCPPAMGYVHYTLPESVTHIGSFSFRGARADLTLTNVKTIGKYAFMGNNLGYYNGNFVLPETIEEIDDYAFSQSYTMEEVTIPASVRKMGEAVFEISEMKKANIYNDCIGAEQFHLCEKLETIELGENIKQIATNAFFQCYSLWYIRMPKANDWFRTIDGVLYTADTTELVLYPRKHDGDEIILPQQIESLRTASLSGVNIRKLVLSTQVQSLSNELFGPSSMYGAKEVVPHIDTIVAPMMSVPQTNDSTFGRLARTNTVLLVPNDSLADIYRSLNVWKDFIIKVDGSIVKNQDEQQTVQTEPDEQSVFFTWPSVEGAASYTLIIWANEERTEKVCTLVFNSMGQLIEINFSKNAPSNRRNAAYEAMSTLSFRVTGLNDNTAYWFTITASDNWETVLYSYAGSFQTLGKQMPTDIRSTMDTPSDATRKYISNGQLFIEKNGMLYDEKGNIINR